MNRRFPDYRPSTALRQAIEALREIRERREAAEKPIAADHPGQLGGGSPGAQLPTPGREGADIGEGLRDKSGTDALSSRRIHGKG